MTLEEIEEYPGQAKLMVDDIRFETQELLR